MPTPHIAAPDPVLVARSRVAVASRRRDPHAVDAARQELTAAKLERAICEAVNAAPPLNDAQRARLARLLAGGASK